MTSTVTPARARLTSTASGRLSLLVASATLLAVPLVPGVAAASDDPQVTLCHATESETNPYVQITVDAAGAYNAHFKQHKDLGAGDIIPPSVYKGEQFSLNWDADGQAIFAAGCGDTQNPGEPKNPDEPKNPETPEPPDKPETPETPVGPGNPAGGGAPTAPESAQDRAGTGAPAASEAGPIPGAAEAGDGPVSTWQLPTGLALLSAGALTGGFAFFRRLSADS